MASAAGVTVGRGKDSLRLRKKELQGALEDPRIVVNPMSGVAPGFTRELCPIIPVEPEPTPRKGSGRLEPRARASSSPAARPGAPDVSDGWISGPTKK